MREIKFRGKVNRAYFSKYDKVDVFDGFVFGTPDTRMLNVPGAEKWRKHMEGFGDWPSIVAMTRDGCPRSIVVIEDTIGEFTGLQDKHGKDIFEGDIIRHVNGTKKDETGKFVESVKIFAVRYDMASFNVSSLALVTDYIEVIGNIYDNPELLEENEL